MALRLAAPALVEDLAGFARAHLASRDIDPVYPVLSYLSRSTLPDVPRAVHEDMAVLRSLVYVAFYNIASSETFGQHPAMHYDDDAPIFRLPTGTERRALRGGHPMARHLADVFRLAREHGSFTAWLRSEGDGWNDVRAAVELAWGNGRWASYKTAEVLQKVNGWPLVAPDMGNYGSSGPLATLRRFYVLPDGQSAEAVAAADEAAEALRDILYVGYGVSLGIEELETVLCDFGSMLKGHFYVGHDIDHMLEQTLHPTVPAVVRDRIWAARAATLPHAYLGELNGWSGVDKALRGRYALTGKIVTRAAWADAWSN